MMEEDLMSRIDAEMSRLKGLLRISERECRERDDRISELEAQNETLLARADELQFCLTQARIVLEHFSKMLPDFEHRRWAHGAMVASDMNLTDQRVAVRKHLATHPLPGMTCDQCPDQAAPAPEAGARGPAAEGEGS